MATLSNTINLINSRLTELEKNTKNLKNSIDSAIAELSRRLGVLEGAPLPAPLPAPTDFTTVNISNDMNSNLEHEFYLHGVPKEWDWGHAAKIGQGANPPGDYSDPHLVPWGVLATAQGWVPGAHNWLVAIHRITTMMKIGGKWNIMHDITAPASITGAEYTDYETNASRPATTFSNKGFKEIDLSDAGSSFHFYPDSRKVLPKSGIQHLCVLIKASLTLKSDLAPDDRASAKVVMLSAGDWYKTATAVWPNNTEFAISRARKIANYPDASHHACHTMVTAPDIDEFTTFVKTQNIL